MVRITEHHDWVAFILLGCIAVYIFMLLKLNREATAKEFLLQDFPEAGNSFLNWIITSIVFCTIFSAFVSQYVPVLPKFLSGAGFFGIELNKFGFTFFTTVIFYLVKTALSYLYFASVGDLKKWGKYYFTVTKFYFILTVILGVGCLIQFYFPVDRTIALYMYAVALSSVFICKVLFLLFNRLQVLPEKWYYKILYICTLQILPVLVLIKFLLL